MSFARRFIPSATAEKVRGPSNSIVELVRRALEEVTGASVSAVTTEDKAQARALVELLHRDKTVTPRSGPALSALRQQRGIEPALAESSGCRRLEQLTRARLPLNSEIVHR